MKTKSLVLAGMLCMIGALLLGEVLPQTAGGSSKQKLQEQRPQRHFVAAPTEAPLQAAKKGAVMLSQNCVQRATCAFFSDILVVVHLNPQRLTYLDALLDYTELFVPNILPVTIPHPSVLANATLDGIDYSGHMYLGRRKQKVMLFQSKFGLWGAHNDLVQVMKHFPGYAGYFLAAQDDALMQYWSMVGLDKQKVWGMATDEWATLNKKYPMCTLSRAKGHRAGNVLTYWSAKRKKKCVVPIHVGRMRDWVGLGTALEKIRRDNQTDRDRIKPGVAFGNPCYYVPKGLQEKYSKYSRYFFEANGYVEFADTALLRAAGETGYEILTGPNVFPEHTNGRFNPVNEFRWSNHFLHPVRFRGELVTRLTDWALSQQIPVRGEGLSEGQLWVPCYTCNENPERGAYGHVRKGRFHTCRKGCVPGAQVMDGRPRGGNVVVLHANATEGGELQFEGFWNAETHDLFFAQYARLNQSL